MDFFSSSRKKLFDLLATSRLAYPMFLAGFVGVITGFITVVFIQTIDWCTAFFRVGTESGLWSLGAAAVVFTPVVGGFLVALIVRYLAPESKGHGVPEVLKAITLKGGRLSAINLIAKPIASAISIGSGFSIGREGPAVQIGATVGSVVGRVQRLSEMRLTNLIACGAAAGISAVFNAPITGVMFALEVILRDFGARALSTTVVSSVAASIVSRMFLGESPAFLIPQLSFQSSYEIFSTFLLLGILSAGTGSSFILMVKKVHAAFDKQPLPGWLKTVTGGFLVGVIGLYLPQIFGMGFTTIEKTFDGSLDLKLMLILIFAKMLATAVSVSCGSSGGTFAPVLFVGAALGGAFGKLVFNHMPFPTALPGAYAIVGMASVFSAAFHAPVTAIFLVFELTRDYRMILPIMIVSVLAHSISKFMTPASMDAVELEKAGVNLDAFGEMKQLHGLQVGHAMQKKFVTVLDKAPAKEVLDLFSAGKTRCVYIVNDKEELLGLVRFEEAQAALIRQDFGSILAGDLATPAADYCFPDEPLNETAKLMLSQGITQIPVMDPAMPRKLVGVVSSENIFEAYTTESTKHSDLIGRFERQGAGDSDAVTCQFRLTVKSGLNGKAIKEINLPDGIVLTSIKRGAKSLVPEGNTVLRTRDRIWAIYALESESAFQNWLGGHSLRVER